MLKVSKLKKDNIVEVKAMKTPSEGAKTIVRGVMILLGEKPEMENIPGSMGKKKENWFGKARKVFFNDPKKFLF